jgi:hypothetical protein
MLAYVVVALVLLLLLLFVVVPRSGFNAPHESARWCQCVDYVRNRFNLAPGGNFVGAADMGPYLEAQGYGRIPDPVVGAIIVFPRWFGSGINATYGHVGVVTTVDTSDPANWHLTVRGARQTHPEWTESGCSNVSDMDHIVVPRGSDVVGFYHAAPRPGPVQLVSNLELSTSNLNLGDTVQASFQVQNTGDEPLTLELLTAGGRQGNTWDAEVLADFPLNRDVHLRPGQVYEYRAIYTPSAAGSYFVEPVARIHGEWTTIESANRLYYDVQAPKAVVENAALPTTAPPPPPTATTTVAPPPPPTVTATVAPPPPPTATATVAPPQATGKAPAVDPPSEPPLIDQWTSHDHLGAGTYTLRIWAGTGIRVYLDGELVFDGLQPQSPATAALNDIPGGPHTVTVRMYVGSESSRAHYTWERAGA